MRLLSLGALTVAVSASLIGTGCGAPSGSTGFALVTESPTQGQSSRDASDTPEVGADPGPDAMLHPSSRPGDAPALPTTSPTASPTISTLERTASTPSEGTVELAAGTLDGTTPTTTAPTTTAQTGPRPESSATPTTVTAATADTTAPARQAPRNDVIATTAPPSVTSSTVAPRAEPAPNPTTPISSTDIAISLEPVWRSYSAFQIQSSGRLVQPGTVPATGVTHGAQLRFGPVADPTGQRQEVLLYRATADDPPTVGGIRTESAHHQLPRGQTFWQVASFMTEDWSGTSDNQIIFQWHHGWSPDETWNLPPLLAFYVIGDQLTIALRYDTVPYPGGSKPTTVHIYRGRMFPPDRWVDLVIQARIEPTNNGFIRIWHEDKLIANYAGPFGYDEPTNADYAKLGYYHWTDAGNTWDRRIPSRSVFVDHMSVIRDPQQRYVLADLQGYLRSRTSVAQP